MLVFSPPSLQLLLERVCWPVIRNWLGIELVAKQSSRGVLGALARFTGFPLHMHASIVMQVTASQVARLGDDIIATTSTSQGGICLVNMQLPAMPGATTADLQVGKALTDVVSRLLSATLVLVHECRHSDERQNRQSSIQWQQQQQHRELHSPESSPFCSWPQLFCSI